MIPIGVCLFRQVLELFGHTQLSQGSWLKHRVSIWSRGKILTRPEPQEIRSTLHGRTQMSNWVSFPPKVLKLHGIEKYAATYR